MSTEPTEEQLARACYLRGESWLFDDQIAHEVGCDGNTLRAALRRGMQDGASRLYAEFSRSYIAASNQVESHALLLIQQGGKDWQRAAWWLERWAPKRWGNKVPDAGPREKVDISELIDEIAERQRTLSELLAQAPPELEAAIIANRGTVLKLLAEHADTPAGVMAPAES